MMHPKYLERIEQLANVQYRIMEAKSDYASLADAIGCVALSEKDRIRLMGELTDAYYEILRKLFLEEILLNKQFY